MTRPPSIRVFDAWNIRQAASEAIAIESAVRAFRALARDLTTVPPPMHWGFPQIHGEAHIKGAHLRGSPLFTLKVATGFFGNVEMGIPTGSGLVLIFDAQSGFPRGILADNGYLTDLRTGAAGALAVRHLTPDRPLLATVLGTGVQAKMQLGMMSHVRSLAGVRVWSRSQSHAATFAERMAEHVPCEIVAVPTVEDAVAEADLVVTVTPSQSPLVQPGWLRGGATVIAVGSDSPVKQELDAHVVAEADKVVTDLTAQCAAFGELHHAVSDGLMTPDDVYAELGQVVVGAKPGREGDETIVCDLTGVGAQDAAIAEAVFVELTGRVTQAGED